jgi:hypothetical protein
VGGGEMVICGLWAGLDGGVGSGRSCCRVCLVRCGLSVVTIGLLLVKVPITMYFVVNNLFSLFYNVN